MRQQYESRGEFHVGPSEVVVFQEEKISLHLQNGDPSPIENLIEKDGWKLTPLNKMEVRRPGVANILSISVI